jgi:AcrR family transcriptional regulator
MELKNNKKLTRKEKEFLYHKKDIMRFAVEVFGKYGYKAATMNEISDTAGYAKGSLYVYFKNKRDLFLEVVNVILNDIEKIIEESFVQSNAKQCMEKYFENLSDYFNANRSAYELLMREVYTLQKGELEKENPVLSRRIIQLNRMIAQKLSSLIKLKNFDKDELECIVTFIHSSFFFSQMKINFSPKKKEKILEMLTKVTFEGILN